MAGGAITLALEPWGVDFTPEGFAAAEQAGVTSPSAAEQYVLFADLRRLHLAPHPADASNFSSLLSKSFQAPPEVAAFAAAAEQAPGDGSGSADSRFCLKKPVLCMVLSFQDVRLPTKDVEEDFSGGAAGIKGNPRRLLSVKLTDGRGATFTGLELRFCSQLDAVPLVPGVKLLLLPGCVLYRGTALLCPQHVRNLGGGAVQLREAFNLKTDVQERRKLVQHILKENTQLQQRIKEDRGDAGPPKFVPFSYSAKLDSVRRRPSTPTTEQIQKQKKTPPPAESPERRSGAQAETGGDTHGSPYPAPRSQLMGTSGGLKHERLRQLDKVNPNTVGADKIGQGKLTVRGGRGRRERRGRDEDLTEYIRPSRGPVSYSLFDLIKADAEHTNSTAATSLLCASEPYANANEYGPPNPTPQPYAAFPSYPAAEGSVHSGGFRWGRGDPVCPPGASSAHASHGGDSRGRGRRGGRFRDRGKGRGNTGD